VKWPPTPAKWFDWLLRDRDGQVVLWQTPNLALGIWIVAWVVALPLHGTVHQLVHFAGGVALFIWAVLELFDGLTPFRRLLGLIVLVLMVSWR
jgi:hypothetical protein